MAPDSERVMLWPEGSVSVITGAEPALERDLKIGGARDVCGSRG